MWGVLKSISKFTVCECDKIPCGPLKSCSIYPIYLSKLNHLVIELILKRETFILSFSGGRRHFPEKVQQQSETALCDVTGVSGGTVELKQPHRCLVIAAFQTCEGCSRVSLLPGTWNRKRLLAGGCNQRLCFLKICRVCRMFTSQLLPPGSRKWDKSREMRERVMEDVVFVCRGVRKCFTWSRRRASV